MTIGNSLVERKELKQVERKGLKEGIEITHQVKSITWINQSSHFKWVSRMVLGEMSLLPSVGACRLWVGEPSVVLGRLTWKWWSKGHLRCLVEAITRVDLEKQATPKRELIMIFQVVFSCWCSHASIDQKMKQANHNKKVHLIISGTHFIWVKNEIQHDIYWSSPSL